MTAVFLSNKNENEGIQIQFFPYRIFSGLKNPDNTADRALLKPSLKKFLDNQGYAKTSL